MMYRMRQRDNSRFYVWVRLCSDCARALKAVAHRDVENVGMAEINASCENRSGNCGKVQRT